MSVTSPVGMVLTMFQSNGESALIKTKSGLDFVARVITAYIREIADADPLE